MFKSILYEEERMMSKIRKRIGVLEEFANFVTEHYDSIEHENYGSKSTKINCIGG